jgi:hypothetical protein
MADILCIMYESFKMKPVEIALKRLECRKRKNDGLGESN